MPTGSGEKRRGATAGEFTVKTCGKKHAWCRECRGDVAEKVSDANKDRDYSERNPIDNIRNHMKEKSCCKGTFCKICAPEKVAEREIARKEKGGSCNGCGRCDKCLGLLAEDGYKICRGCGEKLLIDNFSKRKDTVNGNTYRNKCKDCDRGYTPIFMCKVCSKVFRNTKSGNLKNFVCKECKDSLLGTDTPISKRQYRYIELALGKSICNGCKKEFHPNYYFRNFCSECVKFVKLIMNNDTLTTGQINSLVLRLRIIDKYSLGKFECSCCGYNKVPLLQIDHINGDGKQHRESLGGDNYAVWQWIIDNNYPEGFQILCATCNIKKGIKTECPDKNDLCAKVRQIYLEEEKMND